jgi:hypothetical protein
MKYEKLSKELNSFLNYINKYESISQFIDSKDESEIKETWDVVELCREVKKKMESIYEKL